MCYLCYNSLMTKCEEFFLCLNKITSTLIVKGRTWLWMTCEGGYTHLDVGEVCLERIGAGIASVEEHELGFLQVAGRQALLGVYMRPVKDMSFYTHTHKQLPHPHPHYSLPLAHKRIFPRLSGRALLHPSLLSSPHPP